MRTLRRRWQTIVLTGSLSLITGLGVGWYGSQNVRPRCHQSSVTC